MKYSSLESSQQDESNGSKIASLGLIDIYHVTAGKVLRFLKITIDALLPEGKTKFTLYWKSFEYPRIWQKLPNPISHIDSFMMSDCLHLAMMLPFILNKFLKYKHFKQSEIEKFQVRTGVSRGDLAVKLWLKCWILMAKTMTMVFKHSFTEDDYIKLQECLDNERTLFSRAFKDFENLPNLHVNYHLAQHARNYATLLNTGVRIKEMRYNTLFAMYHLFDGGVDSRFFFTNNSFKVLIHHLKQLLDDWFIIEKHEEDTSEARCISNIYLKKPISRRKAEENLPNDFTFCKELSLVAYQDMGYETVFFENPCQHYELFSR
ncbi:unnamed protein product [Rhizophagus irregularis]|nr:unnamed protein product [Rhizophagus irregularis]